MSKKFIQKNIRLSLELDRYLSKHPKLIDRIPNGAHVIITVKGDVGFNRDSRSLVEGHRSRKIVEARKEGTHWTLQPLVAA